MCKGRKFLKISRTSAQATAVNKATFLALFTVYASTAVIHSKDLCLKCFCDSSLSLPLYFNSNFRISILPGYLYVDQMSEIAVKILPSCSQVFPLLVSCGDHLIDGKRNYIQLLNHFLPSLPTYMTPQKSSSTLSCSLKFSAPLSSCRTLHSIIDLLTCAATFNILKQKLQLLYIFSVCHMLHIWSMFSC